MAQLWRRHTGEMEAVRNPGLRLLPAMLVGVCVAAAVAYFAIGLAPGAALRTRDLRLEVEGQTLRLPDGVACPVARGGCAAALAKLPAGRVWVVTPPQSVLAVVAPALAVSAHRRAAAMLDVGTGRVSVEPYLPAELATWSDLHGQDASVRLRVVMRADGLWLGSAVGAVAGRDPRGPTLLPTADGPDFAGLDEKVRAFELDVPGTEDTCALLPALDTSMSDVVRAAAVMHRHFKHVLLAVP